MSRNRLENLDPERQRALFEAAGAEFAANGFDGASLNRILDKSGIGKSTLYYYFDDKADLFTTMVERAIVLLFRQIGSFDSSALTADNFWSELEQRYGKAVTIVNANDWLVRFGHIFYALRGQPKTNAATDRLFQSVRRWVGHLIARGQELGVIRLDLPESLLVDLTMGLLETLDRWVVGHWSDMSASERQAMPADHMKLFRKLLDPS